MDYQSHRRDPELQKFDEWLRDTGIQAPADMTARVRARLQDSSEMDGVLDKLLQPDYSLRDPSMLQRVRQRLANSEREDNRKAWFKWLPPLAAAATLTLAILSFQVKTPTPSTQDPASPTLADLDFQAIDLELTRIMVLAASLQGSADVSQLDSAEDLAFLFD